MNSRTAVLLAGWLVTVGAITSGRVQAQEGSDDAQVLLAAIRHFEATLPEDGVTTDPLGLDPRVLRGGGRDHEIPVLQELVSATGAAILRLPEVTACMPGALTCSLERVNTLIRLGEPEFTSSTTASVLVRATYALSSEMKRGMRDVLLVLRFDNGEWKVVDQQLRRVT